MASSYGSLNLFPWQHVRDLQCRKRLIVVFFLLLSVVIVAILVSVHS